FKSRVGRSSTKSWPLSIGDKRRWLGHPSSQGREEVGATWWWLLAVAARRLVEGATVGRVALSFCRPYGRPVRE
ncbi:MAG: hypothetical protein ACK53L_13645, partial [Pirellulaceae bacterium]